MCAANATDAHANDAAAWYWHAPWAGTYGPRWQRWWHGDDAGYDDAAANCYPCLSLCLCVLGMRVGRVSGC